MPPPVTHILLGVALGALASCEVPIEIGDTVEGGTDAPAEGALDAPAEGAPDGPAEGAATCTAPERCVAGAPEGWQGPVAGREIPAGDEGVICATADPAYPIQAVELFFGLEVEATTCECSCGAPRDLQCDPAIVSAEKTLCAGTDPSPVAVGDGACVPLGSGVVDGVFSFTDPGVVGGRCEPTVDARLPVPTWVARWSACAPSSPPPRCGGDGVCLRDPADGVRCVLAPGDRDCPPGEYSLRRVVYRGVADDRSCTACECSSAQGSCRGRVDVVQALDPACGPGGTLLVGSLDPGQCSPRWIGATHARYVAQPAAACTPTGGEPVGTVAPATPTTVCCAP